jgi:hypothetical protein
MDASSASAAKQSFDRARLKAFWNALVSTLTGRSNQLLAWEDVREQLQIGGQIYRGIQSVPLEKIIGSVNRYRDFDRAFLPRQTHTEARWRNISSAYYQEKHLPPVQLYKVGEAYFVLDGNHRVSVAHEQGRAYIDAEVTEAEAPVPVSADLDARDLQIKGEYAEFLRRTRLDELRPEQEIEFTIAGGYQRLLEHIAVHRYFMGGDLGRYVPEEEAVTHWYDQVYRPLVQIIRREEILKEFPHRTEADLYLWVMEHLHFLRERESEGPVTRVRAAKHFAAHYNASLLKRALSVVGGLWSSIEDVGEAEAAVDFLVETRLDELRPDHGIRVSQPGGYQRLLEHIAVHRHFMGLEQQRFIPQEEAILDWYDHIYHPIVRLVREEGLTKELAHLTETEIYLWIMEHLQFLQEQGAYLSHEEAVEDFIRRYTLRPLKEVLDMVQDLLEVGTGPAGATTYRNFLKYTQLDRLRPEHRIATTITSGYRRLLEHIAAHRYFMGINQQRSISEEEAVIDWYDHVYLAVVQVIRDHGLLQNFPKRTEADLYLWFMEHRHALEERGEMLRQGQLNRVQELTEEEVGAPLERAVGAVQQLLEETNPQDEGPEEEHGGAGG